MKKGIIVIQEIMEKTTPPYLVLEFDADLSIDDDVQLLNQITENGERNFRSLFVALPFTRMKEISEKYPDSGIHFGVSSFNSATPTHFTHSIAGTMVKNGGGSFGLVGTRSERFRLKERQSEELKAKLESAIKASIKPLYFIDLNQDIAPQLELLNHVPEYFNDPHPLLIIQPLFTSFSHYLPSTAEIQSLYDQVKTPLQETLSEHYKKLSLLIELPIDLIGFSKLIEGTPFDGLFGLKSGIYPHALHEEMVQLAKIHAIE